VPNLGAGSPAFACWTTSLTVDIGLKAPFAPLLSAMELTHIKTYAITLIGTSPLQFVSWQQGAGLTYLKDGESWKPTPPESSKPLLEITSAVRSQITDLVSGDGQTIDTSLPSTSAPCALPG
jgi:ABC-type transport system substrate-binding protein